jgi:hypothetical protein
MNTHMPHWIAGSQTHANAHEKAEADERLAHQVYGQLVKHFGLGAAHTFSAWDKLTDDERQKWVAALTDVRQDQAEQASAGLDQQAQ